MNVEEFAKTLGLPGLVIVAWYMLERLRIERVGKAEETRAKVDEARATAMAEGFRSVSAQISAHQTADLESHAEMATALARVEARQEAAEARHDRTGERLRLVTDNPHHGDR